MFYEELLALDIYFILVSVFFTTNKIQQHLI